MQNEFETIICTSKLQESRGAKAFYCLNTNATYTSHSNGYIRRTVINSKGIRINYQLNRINRNTGKRVMINNEALRLIELQRYSEIYVNRWLKNITASI